jgi:hypothetical protein
LAMFVTALLACGGVSPIDNLKTRSAFELKCPASQIDIRNLDDEGEAYGVSGCGRRAVYVWHCGGDGTASG